MNAEECARLVGIVRSLYPAQRFDDEPLNVVNAWGAVVADLNFAEAHTAVTRIARRGSTWCSPGDVRTEVARMRNVLAPDVDQLLGDVRDVASKDGVGRRLLHPAARKVYDSIGGAQAIRRLDTRGLQTLRRQLVEACEKHDEATLVEELPPYAPPALPVRVRMSELEGKPLDEVHSTHELEQRRDVEGFTQDFGKMPD